MNARILEKGTEDMGGRGDGLEDGECMGWRRR
jgi:hypothetical protein